MAYTNPEEMEQLVSPAAAAAGKTASSEQMGLSGDGETAQNGEILEEECGTEEKPVHTEESEAGEADESLAAEELLRCREELRRTREELNRLRGPADGEEKENFRPTSIPEGPEMVSQPEEKPLPAFSRSFLSGGVEAGEDRYRKIMGL